MLKTKLVKTKMTTKRKHIDIFRILVSHIPLTIIMIEPTRELNNQNIQKFEQERDSMRPSSSAVPSGT